MKPYFVVILGVLLGLGLVGVMIFGVSAVNTYETNNGCIIRWNGEFLRGDWNPILCEKIVTTTPIYHNGASNTTVLKPLILLYPQSDEHVSISLQYPAGFFATFPEYNEKSQGWNVLAHPDGTLYNPDTNQETY